MARTYAKNGRITINTIIRVAAHHLVQGNTDLCNKALKELKKANHIQRCQTKNIHDIIDSLNNNINLSKEQITKELQLNNIKWM